MRTMFWVAAVIFIADQITKYYVVHVLNLDRILAINVWDPFFNLRMAWNDGINFGLLGGAGDWKRWLLIGIALVISAAVIWWVRREKGSFWYHVAAGLLVGGALGNVIDRLVYGAVADFINMSCCGIDNPFAFNIADISIFVGAVGLVLLAPDNSGKRKKKAA
jgi:signal peptidase II